jgi:phage tail sheath protein FI
MFYGGFDGLNILDRDNRKMNDRASSIETGGKANGITEAGLTANAAGEGVDNNIVSSYRVAANILTDEFSSKANIVAIPGIRDALVQDHLADKVRANALMVHVRDIASYDDYGLRLWDDSTNKPSVRYTSETFAARNIDNNYTSVYYPDVFIETSNSPRRIKVPASVAILGAIAYNDRVAYPWFAPAGFNRGALDFVKNVTVRLNAADRDTLYDARINPIASFPSGGFVIFGQKTLQLSKSSLDRLNVRRLMVEVKRTVAEEANKILFEQNTPTTRQRFVNAVTPKLGVIQAQAGIERFQVVMDSSNNSQADIDANRVNGRIVIVPTRTIEFIAIDFVITNSGVSFQ